MKRISLKRLIRDFFRFSEEDFNSELAQVDWGSLLARTQGNIDIALSKIYNKLNKLVNKDAPLKPLSKRKFKQSLKPWITKGLLKSKNALFASGDIDKYKFYRNKITTLIRQSKKLYYHTYFYKTHKRYEENVDWNQRGNESQQKEI